MAGMEEDFAMSRRCELTAKGPQVGHKVSHSNIKTKRRFLPNLVNVTFISDALARNVRLRVSTNALKSVDHNGGLDAYLLKARADALSPRALELKWAIGKKLGVATNNVAEYKALIAGLECALEHGATALEVRMDSELVVRQMTGVYKVKNEGLKPLFQQAKGLAQRFGTFRIQHVRREHNSRADAEANKALDQQVQ